MPPDLSPFSQVLFMEAAKVLNRRASANFARRRTAIGLPFPKRTPPDLRPPPGYYDNPEYEAEG